MHYYPPPPPPPVPCPECEKRNIGLKYAKKAGVDYFMTMDCDEFYIKEEVEKAKRFIIITGVITPITLLRQKEFCVLKTVNYW